MQVEVHQDETAGTVTFDPWGRCELAAGPGLLTVRIESTDDEGVQRIQDIVTNNLARFSSRDPLAVFWRHDEVPGEAPAHRNRPQETRVITASTQGLRGIEWARGNISTVVLVLAAVLLIAVHLGLAGTIVAGSRWTRVAANVVAVLVVVKVAVIVVVRQRLHRRRKVD